jgi:hypothetical protein
MTSKSVFVTCHTIQDSYAYHKMQDANLEGTLEAWWHGSVASLIVAIAV